MSQSTVDYEVSESIATITLNRPDRMNAFTVPMMQDLLDTFDRTDADDAVRVVILTGAGRAFCAGADLGFVGGDTFAGKDAAAGGSVPRDEGGRVVLRIFQSKKPVIAAVNGAAVGVGATMTLPADVRLMAEGAKYGFVFAARGIVPDGACSWFLPRIVGISQALEWCLTARVFPAQEAHDAGLVKQVYAPDELLPAARALAQEMIASTAPVSATITRQMLWRMLTAGHPMEAHRVDSLAIAQTGKLADATEGITAFFEKRPAEWKLSPSRDTPDWHPWWEEPQYE